VFEYALGRWVRKAHNSPQARPDLRWLGGCSRLHARGGADKESKTSNPWHDAHVRSLELWTSKRHNIHRGQDISTPPQSLSLVAVRANNLINSTHRPQPLSPSLVEPLPVSSSQSWPPSSPLLPLPVFYTTVLRRNTFIHHHHPRHTARLANPPRARRDSCC
jgi:hypothetical protein